MGTGRGRAAWLRRVVRPAAAGLTVVLLALLAMPSMPAPPGPPAAAGPLAAPPSSSAPAGPTPTPPPQAEPLAAPSTPEPQPQAASRRSDPLAEAAARARRITAATAGWASFTLADRQAGRLVGDTRTDEVTNSESVVKAWLAADLLARAAAEKRRLTTYERARMTAMIRVSDDNAAEVIWRWLGADASIRRMIKSCRMTDTRVYPGWWSLTQISSRDLARLGACLAPGRGKLLSTSASKALLDLMRSVAPSDAFGIQQARPAGRGVRIAVKNGWTQHGGTGVWNV